MKNILLALSFLLVTAITFGQTIYRVNLNSTSNSKDGLSWSTAFSNLEDAINAASGGDEIWITNSSYKVSATDTNKFISVNKDLTFIGGFNGNETSVSELNPYSNTSFDGNIGNMLSSAHFLEIKSNVIFRNLNLNNFKSSVRKILLDSAIFYLHKNSSLTLENATFQGNEANIFSCEDSTSLTIKKCIFNGNNSTTQKYIAKTGLCNLTVKSSIFNANCTNTNLFNSVASIANDAYHINILDCEFYNTLGPVLYNLAVSSSIKRSNFRFSNSNGQAISQTVENGKLIMDSCTFEGNISNSYIYIGKGDSTIISNATVDFDEAASTYFLYTQNSHIILDNVLMKNGGLEIKPLYLYTSNKNILLKKVEFNNFIGGNSLLDFWGQKITFDSCNFNNITNSGLLNGFIDTIIIKNSSFTDIVGSFTNSLSSPSFNLRSISNCLFNNWTLKDKSFLFLGNSLDRYNITNSIFENFIFESTNSYKNPFLFSGASSINFTNSTFNNINCLEYFWDFSPYAQSICKGVLFENVTAEKAFMKTAGSPIFYNCNFNLTQPIFEQSSNNTMIYKTNVINSVLFTTSDSIFYQSLDNTAEIHFSNCLSNKNLGTTNQTFDLSYEELYFSDLSTISNKGISIDSLNSNFVLDINSNQRIQDGTIDLGVYEYPCPTCVTSLFDYKKDVNVLYPNPFNNTINSSIYDKDFEISVFNSDGKLVLRSKQKSNIDVSYLPKGLYFYELQSDETIIKGKLEKM